MRIGDDLVTTSVRPVVFPPAQYSGNEMLGDVFMTTLRGQQAERHYRIYGQQPLVASYRRAVDNGATPKEALSECLDRMNIHMTWTVRPRARAHARAAASR